ncbi:universal stress protein [Atopomonas sediminilitoris]|uniref:universal stress protein n=1 Tax=Atopomonas sediminilitoris TaxID=2919919 RepID=UPI001F4EBB23|nr:universal stress protein [Atopomonas sediminilitoris]MCJ8168046.1 universal stress protein [Atopomonas sediminilitoris]
MQAIRSILVVVDAKLSDGLALKRAQLIANVTKSHLHLLACSKEPQDSFLAGLSAGLAADGFSVSAQTAWHKSEHETIIMAQQAEGCGLVVKQHLPDNPLKKALLTPEDWKLLRHCPAPVLMVKTEAPWTGGKILAAVDVGNSDSEHKTMHASLVKHAVDIAGLAQGQVHVFTAYPAPMLSAADPTFQLQETIEARYRDACKGFMQEHQLNEGQLHLAEGPADALIPKIAHDLGASVTVMGTVARSGIAGALIGNTAEVVLDALETDILVLKPEDVMEHLETLLAGNS